MLGLHEAPANGAMSRIDPPELSLHFGRIFEFLVPLTERTCDNTKEEI